MRPAPHTAACAALRRSAPFLCPGLPPASSLPHKAPSRPSNSLGTWLSGPATVFAPTAPVPTQRPRQASPLRAVRMPVCTCPPPSASASAPLCLHPERLVPLREGLVRGHLPGAVAPAPARGSPAGPRAPQHRPLSHPTEHRAGDRPVLAASPGQAICGPRAGSE